MGQVGSLGEVVFETSSDRIFTWNDCHRDAKANFATHEVLDSKAHLQFVGLELEEYSFSFILDCSWCIPEDEMQRIDAMRASGRAFRLMLGCRDLGYFVIESITETRKRTDDVGHVMVAYLQVKLKEYN